MYYGHVEKLITDLSPVQRSVLGIPKPGDAYWTLQKIKQLQIRYPSMDVEPYISKSSSIMATSKSCVSDDTFLSRANVQSIIVKIILQQFVYIVNAQYKIIKQNSIICKFILFKFLYI